MNKNLIERENKELGSSNHLSPFNIQILVPYPLNPIELTCISRTEKQVLRLLLEISVPGPYSLYLGPYDFCCCKEGLLFLMSDGLFLIVLIVLIHLVS